MPGEKFYLGHRMPIDSKSDHKPKNHKLAVDLSRDVKQEI